MPSRYADISAAQTAQRIETMRDTVTLEAVRGTYDQLSMDACNAGHEDLSSKFEETAATLRELVASGEPRGLTDSARMILAIDTMIDTAGELRDGTACAWGRYDHHTKEATEALEILIAYSALLETADFDLRTNLTA